MSCNCRSYTAETVEMLLIIALSVHAHHMENFITEILLTPCLSPNKCYNKTAGAINQARQKGIHMALFGLFGKKETGNETIPQNDVEKWILGTYAMWAAYADGDWHYIAGSAEKNKQEGASMRVMLRRDWEVSNKTALLDMVDYLTALYREGTDCEAEDIASGAWDLCRACQILGMGFVGGYIDRQEMVQKSAEVGRVMQKYYHSWAELYDSYIKGYRDWRAEQGGDAQKDIEARETLCRDLRNDPNGPCSVPWDLKL